MVSSGETARVARRRRRSAIATSPVLLAHNLATLSVPTLRQMLAAGSEAQECCRVLKKGGLNLVGEVLREQGEFVEYSHYPADDVYDEESRAQYYYHAHRPGEHGHFHTFLRVGNGNPDGSPGGGRSR